MPAVGQLPGLGPRLAAVVRSRDEVPDRDEPLGHRVVRRPARCLVDGDDDREQAAVRELRERAAAEVPAGGQRARRTGWPSSRQVAAVVVAPDEARPPVGALPRRADPVAEHDRAGRQPRDPRLAGMAGRIVGIGLPDRGLIDRPRSGSRLRPSPVRVGEPAQDVLRDPRDRPVVVVGATGCRASRSSRPRRPRRRSGTRGRPCPPGRTGAARRGPADRRPCAPSRPCVKYSSSSTIDWWEALKRDRRRQQQRRRRRSRARDRPGRTRSRPRPSGSGGSARRRSARRRSPRR